jgi:ribosomal protein S27E
MKNSEIVKEKQKHIEKEVVMSVKKRKMSDSDSSIVYVKCHNCGRMVKPRGPGFGLENDRIAQQHLFCPLCGAVIS